MACGGDRSTTETHYKAAADHGFAHIADFQIMDEVGSLPLPVDGGFHLSENLVGALKNIAIGMASREGKLLIHSAVANRTSRQSAAQDDFSSRWPTHARPCSSRSQKMADIGVLASTDPVALDQACVDLVYASDDNSVDLTERMESRNGAHVLEAAESLGVGSRAYELVEIKG
ncbi:MAG: DUF362 domain-containing protein [Atopobiaceae bacterium]|nr:DUF362 domain-containing protein [Atopobiaceae bacterium]